MAIHKDHTGKVLKPEEVETYWRGFIQGQKKRAEEIPMTFDDVTGFERYLLNNGWVLIPGNYNSYLSTMGTVARGYEKLNDEIWIGLIGQDKVRLGVWLGKARESVETVNGDIRLLNHLPLTGFESAVNFITGKSDTILRGEILNDI